MKSLVLTMWLLGLTIGFTACNKKPRTATAKGRAASASSVSQQDTVVAPSRLRMDGGDLIATGSGPVEQRDPANTDTRNLADHLGAAGDLGRTARAYPAAGGHDLDEQGPKGSGEEARGEADLDDGTAENHPLEHPIHGFPLSPDEYIPEGADLADLAHNSDFEVETEEEPGFEDGDAEHTEDKQSFGDEGLEDGDAYDDQDVLDRGLGADENGDAGHDDDETAGEREETGDDESESDDVGDDGESGNESQDDEYDDDGSPDDSDAYAEREDDPGDFEEGDGEDEPDSY